MDKSLTSVMHACSAGSIDATFTFPEVVKQLTGIGVESYHCDLYRREKTYYLPDGQSHVEPEDELDPREFAAASITTTFSPDGIKTALTAVQGRKIDYVEFLRRIMAAGCTGYAVFVTGRRALYFGRNGDSYLEPFPTAK